MAVRKLKEELDFDRCFTDVCKVYVNGKELDISGLDTYDQVGDVFAAECRRTPELEDWIREYLNSLGDPLVDDSDSVEEVCRLFAQELDIDLHDSEPGEFYVDGSGSVFDSDVRVEIFEESVKRGRNSMSVKRVNESGRMVNGRPRELSPQYDARKSFYNKAYVDDDNDGNMTLYSYKTPVCRIRDGKVELLPKWDYSATTLRHVKEFLQQNGFSVGTKAQIAKMYSVVEENAKRSRKSRVNEDYLDDFDGYPGIADVKRYLQIATDNADDLHFYLDNALRALDDNYIEMFSGPDDAYAVAETLDRIGKAISDLQSQLPDEIINAPDAGTDYR